MKIIVLADGAQRAEILSKETSKQAELIFVDDLADLFTRKNADVYFILSEETEITELNTFTSKPVFLNAVTLTLKELDMPKNVSRINGWPTFLERDNWEVATGHGQTVKDIFHLLHWKYLLAADEPGLVSARIVSMIINEAFYALGEGVSTKEEIDVAMKLGTNYPYGPFEWAEKIGLKNIHQLLGRLSEKEKRYNVSPDLIKQINR